MANLVAHPQPNYLSFGPERQLLIDRFHHHHNSLRQSPLHPSPLRIQTAPSPVRTPHSPIRPQQSPVHIQPSPIRTVQPSPLRQSPIQPSPLRLDITDNYGPHSPLLSPAEPNNKENHTDKLCKRRIDFPQHSQQLLLKPQKNGTKRATVARRNERERNRVKLVNLGFATLREHVPNGKSKKKMSKVDTLRSAANYIRQLKKLLGDENALNGQAFRVDLRSPPLDVTSTGYASDCSSEPAPHDDDDYLDFSTWFK